MNCSSLDEYVKRNTPIGTGAQGQVYAYGDKVIKNIDADINEEAWRRASDSGVGPTVYGTFSCGNERFKNNYIIMKKLSGKFNAKDEKQLKQVPELITRMIEAGIFHGDTHDENFMIDETGRLFLIDFDLSSVFTNRGYNFFDKQLRQSKYVDITANPDESFQVNFTPEQLERIQRMRPSIEEYPFEIEERNRERELIERKRKEAEERARLAAEERKKQLLSKKTAGRRRSRRRPSKTSQRRRRV
jgi:tRNA A-37 threonylcarbamoyl transferase component Bud32